MDIQKRTPCHKTGTVTQLVYGKGNAALLWLQRVRRPCDADNKGGTDALQFPLIAEVVNDKT